MPRAKEHGPGKGGQPVNIQSQDTAREQGITRRGMLKWAVGSLTAAIAAMIGWPLVASLIGGGEEMTYVEFDYGSAALDAATLYH